MAKKEHEKRRAKKANLLGKVLMLLPVSCALLYPLYLGAQLDLVEDTYVSSRLPEVFDGLRVAFVSDIHYGAYLNEQRVRRLVSRVNALQPDLIILGGDYGEDSQGAVDFFRLQPGFQAKTGVLGVMGNHDRTLPESNLQVLMRAMADAGVRPLVNDVFIIEKAGKTLAIAGVDDYYNGAPRLDRAADLCQGAEFTIFAPHTPDILPEAYRLPGGPFFQLALCGHTHGGQVVLFNRALKSSSDYGEKYRTGWKKENGVDIMISNGVGTSFLPVRLGARPQIHLITLKCK